MRLSPALLAVMFTAASAAALIGYTQTSQRDDVDCSSFNAETDESQNYLCEQQYALCTSAPCVPVPGKPEEAVCFCNVEEGKAMFSQSCEAVRPVTGAHGIRTVYSGFSLDQFYTGKKAMKCDSGTPWTWCLNKTCTVYPYDPTRAICTCDVKYTGEWTTLGGDCNLATCGTAYWSGAPIKDFEEAAEFMTKALKLKKSPVKRCE